MPPKSTTTSRISPRRFELAGRRFGRLVVLRRSFKKHHWHWRCLCDCGTEKDVVQPQLITGRTRSCGCLHRELLAGRARTHGLCGTPEYLVWRGMKARCLNRNEPAYKNYGGRGIGICERWLDSPEAFLEDMGPRPSPLHSIERLDNDGDYCPENCCWATDHEQARNKRNVRLISFQGKTMTAKDWSIHLGFPPHTITNRLHLGWSIERALTTPLRMWPKK